MKTYQFRLYPNSTQKKRLEYQFEQHRLLYNTVLEERIEIYKETGKSPTSYDQMKNHVPLFKNNCNVSSLQQTVRRMFKSFQYFFKRFNGYPQPKDLGCFKTIEYCRYGDGARFKKDKLYIQFVGELKVVKHREIDGHIKTLSVTKHNDQYFVNLFVETAPKLDINSEKVVGIDFGIKNTITTSDGTVFTSPFFLKNKLKDVKRLKKNKNYQALRKIQTKLRNQRKDFNHKLSLFLVKTYDIICLEDYEMSRLISEVRQVNSRSYDIAIGQLKQCIIYKAKVFGKQVIIVNPCNTTKECSNCGELVEKSIQTRIHKCKCGCKMNRDINAAINIMRRGLSSLGENPSKLSSKID